MSDRTNLLNNVAKIRKFKFIGQAEMVSGVVWSGEEAYIIQSDGTVWTFFDELEKNDSNVADVWTGSRFSYHYIYETNRITLYKDGELKDSSLGSTDGYLALKSRTQLTGVAEFTVSDFYDCAAIKTDGSLWVWGLDGVWGNDPDEILHNLIGLDTLTPKKVLDGMAVAQ
jgi:hypothetical protein